MRQTLEVLNDLEKRGFFSRYAIGGAMAALFYMEPFETEDLDVLVLLPPDAHPIAPLGPLYEELKTRGYPEDGPYSVVEGVPVQFLPTYNTLIEETVREAGEVAYHPDSHSGTSGRHHGPDRTNERPDAPGAAPGADVAGRESIAIASGSV